MGNQKSNTAYTRRRQTKQMHKAINIGHHYMQRNTNNVNKTWALLQTNTNNVNKTWALLQTIGGKDELNIVFYAKFITDITTPNSDVKT
jgi:hypothetical protein